MTKSESGMVTKVITHLLTDTLSVLVIKRTFSLLPLGRYLLPITTRTRYQSTCSSGKFFFTTTSRNVTIVRCRMSLVTIPVLDFVIIYWIRWIQRKSFRKNSIVFRLSTFLFWICVLIYPGESFGFWMFFKTVYGFNTLFRFRKELQQAESVTGSKTFVLRNAYARKNLKSSEGIEALTPWRKSTHFLLTQI